MQQLELLSKLTQDFNLYRNHYLSLYEQDFDNENDLELEIEPPPKSLFLIDRDDYAFTDTVFPKVQGNDGAAWSSLKVWADKDIKSGDPERHGKYLYYKQLLGARDYLVDAAAKRTGWQNEHFSEKSAGEYFYVRQNNNIYVLALERVYGYDRLWVTNALDHFRSITDPFTEDQKKILHALAILLHNFLPRDIKLYNENEELRNGLASNLDSMTMDNAKDHLIALVKFASNKTEAIYDELGYDVFNSYNVTDEPFLDSELERLTDKVNVANEEIVDQFVECNDFVDWEGSAYGQMFLDYGLEGSSTHISEVLWGAIGFIEINKEGTPLAKEKEAELNESGVSYIDIQQFIYLFHQKALQKAFLMLDENYAILDDEEKRYSDLAKVNGLIEWVRSNFKEPYTKANKLRVRAIQDQIHQEVHPLSRKDRNDLVWYLKRLPRGDVVP